VAEGAFPGGLRCEDALAGRLVIGSLAARRASRTRGGPDSKRLGGTRRRRRNPSHPREGREGGSVFTTRPRRLAPRSPPRGGPGVHEEDLDRLGRPVRRQGAPVRPGRRPRRRRQPRTARGSRTTSPRGGRRGAVRDASATSRRPRRGEGLEKRALAIRNPIFLPHPRRKGEGMNAMNNVERATLTDARSRTLARASTMRGPASRSSRETR